MKLLDVARKQPRVYDVVLSGCCATFLDDFRRRSHRFQDLSRSLGLPAGARTIESAMVLGHALAIVAICFGMFWTPEKPGSNTLVPPLTIPAVASVVAVPMAAILALSRRRYRTIHKCWTGVSGPLESGMRSGLILTDLGIATMIIVQNLRWHQTSNVLAVGALSVAILLALTPARKFAVRIFAIIATLLSTSIIISVSIQISLFDHVSAVTYSLLSVTATVAGLALFVALCTPFLYAVSSHAVAMRTTGLLRDMSIKSAGICIISSLSIFVAQLTAWPTVAPFVALVVFFLGLVVYRSSFARISSPEALGFGLFLVRLRPDWARSIIFRSSVTSAAMVIPMTLALAGVLIMNQSASIALLLCALVLLEMSIDALIIQRRTAVMPASHISALPQRSKAGVGAAVCAGLSFVFSGILGTVMPEGIDTTWLFVISGSLVLVAVLLIALVVFDAPEWLREISCTETEDA